MEFIIMLSIPVVFVLFLAVVGLTMTKEEKAVVDFMINHKLFVLPYPYTAEFAKANYEWLKKYNYI